LGVFHGHTDFVQAVAFTPDGRELATGSKDGMLKLWDRQSSLPVVLDGVTPGMMGLWFRRDGRRLVITATVDGRASRKGWDPGTGELDLTLTGIDRSKLEAEYLPYPVQYTPGIPVATATSPDGKLVARGVPGINLAQSERDQRSRDAINTVEVWDVASGRLLRNLVGHTANVICVAFSPDSRRIATCSYDQTVKLWDAATGREVFTLRGHTAGAIALAFSPDGHRIVSGGLDLTARVWDATPLPTDTLQAQESRYRQKQTELQARRDNSEAAKSAGARTNLSLTNAWGRSADEIAQSVESDPNNPGIRCLHVLALVQSGDRAGVRRACEDLLKRFGKTTDPAQANSVAWYCVLAPDAVADYEAPVRLAEASLAGYPERGRQRGDALRTLGAALYRAGRFKEAVRRLDESVQTRGDGGDPRGLAFLALAHHRVGHGDEARRWLDKLAAHRPHEGFEFSRDDVEVRVLHREAESLVLGSPR
jgi:hypothetical protein